MAKTYTTSSGITVDMEAIRARHQKEVAAGNMRVNARGDELTNGGKIKRKASDIYRAQHAEHSKSTTKQVSIRDQSEPTISTKPAKKKKKEITLENGDIVMVDQDQDPGAEFND